MGFIDEKDNLSQEDAKRIFSEFIENITHKAKINMDVFKALKREANQ